MDAEVIFWVGASKIGHLWKPWRGNENARGRNRSRLGHCLDRFIQAVRHPGVVSVDNQSALSVCQS
jgi:hypothetical protein